MVLGLIPGRGDTGLSQMCASVCFRFTPTVLNIQVKLIRYITFSMSVFDINICTLELQAWWVALATVPGKVISESNRQPSVHKLSSVTTRLPQ